jgi:ABC-2 type transport system permease protein
VVKKVNRLISAELFKLRKRSLPRILLLVLVGIMILISFLLLAISKVNLPAGVGGEQLGNIQNLLGLPMALPFAMSIIASFGSVLAIILTASSIGSEYNWRNIRTEVINSDSRSKLLTAKLISCVIFVLIGMVIGIAAGFVMSLITTAIGGYKFDFSFATGTYLWDQFLQFWRTFYVLVPYMLLGFMFSIIGRSAMPGIALGIGILFLETIITTFMSLAGGWVAKIPEYLPATNVNAITSLADIPSNFMMGMGGASGDLPGVTHAFVTLAVYSIVFLIISFYMFRKRDITG